MTATVERTAGRLVEAFRNRLPFEASAAESPRDEAEAYRVQDLVFAALHSGARASAWKVGAPSAEAEPIAAPIAQAGLYRSPARVPGAAFNMIGVEAEIAFRLARDLPARATRYADHEVADAVGEALVVIELCDARLSNWKSASPMWKLADFQMNAGLVLGSGTRDWRDLEFAAQKAELWIDGQRKAEAVGVHPYGNPVRLMPWAAAHCAVRVGGLRTGDVVTTGSWTGMQFVQAGCEVVARFPGIGEARVRVER